MTKLFSGFVTFVSLVCRTKPIPSLNTAIKPTEFRTCRLYLNKTETTFSGTRSLI